MDRCKLSLPKQMIPKKIAGDETEERRRGEEGTREGSNVEVAAVGQKGRRNSSVPALIARGVDAVRRRSVTAKIAPSGVQEGEPKFDEKVVREMERRGSFHM